MKLTLSAFLLALAVVCFTLAAFGAGGRVSWRDLGYSFVAGAVLVMGLGA